jgi:PST family polysaccharide transporter
MKIHEKLSSIRKRPALLVILKNISWLSFERFFQLFISLVVGIFVVRYLGPTDFGLMSFGIALSGVMAPFVSLGISNIVVRELVERSENKYIILGTSFFLKMISGIFFFFVLILIILILRPNDILSLLVVSIFGINFLLQAFDVPSEWFDSQIDSKKSVIARSVALIGSNILKILCMFFNFSLIFIVLATLVETLLRVSTIMLLYRKAKQEMLKWRFDIDIAKKFFKDGWPLLLSSGFSSIQLSLGQVLIGIIMSNAAVGIYAIAAKLAVVGYFLPGAIMTSLFPSIIKMKSDKVLFEKRLQRMFDVIVWFPLVIIIPISLLSPHIIDFLYGAEFSSAAPVLNILIWGLLFVFIQTGVDTCLLAENKAKLIMLKTFGGAVICVILNILLIPILGILGAAVALLLSYIFTSFLGNLLFNDSKKYFFMVASAMNPFAVLKRMKP